MVEELPQRRRVRLLSDLIERETDKTKLETLAKELRAAIERERELNRPRAFKARGET